MARKPSGKKQSSPDAIEDAEGNVDKIRQILFGGQMRDYEQRFEAMETRITQNLDRVSRELEQRLERLNTYTRREVDKLGEQIKAEKKDRTADGKKAGVPKLMNSWRARGKSCVRNCLTKVTNCPRKFVLRTTRLAQSCRKKPMNSPIKNLIGKTWPHC